MHKGHLPEEFNIGADNTPKETKNQYTFWFLIWLLCVLEDTPLKVITVMFLLVGHTHNKLDRMFSRISVALQGKETTSQSKGCCGKSGRRSCLWICIRAI